MVFNWRWDTVIYAVTTATYVISAVCVFNYVLLQDAVRSTSEWSEIFSLDLIKLWALCSLAHRMAHEVFVTKTSFILFLLKNILSWIFRILSTIHVFKTSKNYFWSVMSCLHCVMHWPMERLDNNQGCQKLDSYVFWDAYICTSFKNETNVAFYIWNTILRCNFA